MAETPTPTVAVSSQAAVNLEIAMATNTFPVGTTVSLPAVFMIGTAPFVPTPDPVCVIVAPTGEEVDISTSIVEDAPGSFHALFTPAVAGLFRYRWFGAAGGLSAAGSDVFTATEI
jgi:hypothetical protein